MLSLFLNDTVLIKTYVLLSKSGFWVHRNEKWNEAASGSSSQESFDPELRNFIKHRCGRHSKIVFSSLWDLCYEAIIILIIIIIIIVLTNNCKQKNTIQYNKYNELGKKTTVTYFNEQLSIYKPTFVESVLKESIRYGFPCCFIIFLNDFYRVLARFDRAGGRMAMRMLWVKDKHDLQFCKFMFSNS